MESQNHDFFNLKGDLETNICLPHLQKKGDKETTAKFYFYFYFLQQRNFKKIASQSIVLVYSYPPESSIY